MRSVLRVACCVLVLLGLSGSARAQVLTGGQILPANALTYIPATNGTQSALASVTVPQTIVAIGNQNFGATNQLNGTAFLTINGILVCQLIQAWGSNGSTVPANTNLVYNPTQTNNTATPDIVYTLPTNLTFGITYGAATTNTAYTNLQGTYNRLK